jgi:toxin FitB
MIILDTNVISEIFRPSPAPQVLHWLAAQPAVETFTTAVNEAEIYRGLEHMPPGKRRTDLYRATEIYFQKNLTGKVLNFGSDAARIFAAITAHRARIGRPILDFDAQIAAITRAHNATLATRNTKDFEHCGIDLFDPWKAR